MASKKPAKPELHKKKPPKSETSEECSPKDEPSEEYRRFEDTMRTVLSVPKEKITEAEKRRKGKE